jgi:Protein of unknown function (DUF992)
MRRRGRHELLCGVEPSARLRLYADRQSSRILQGNDQQDWLDIGFQSRGVIVWAVLSPGLTRGPGSLSGNYVGASAELVAGVGASANALVGGNKVVLNPLSVSGDVGLNVAGGIADIDLVYVGGPPPMLRGWVPFGSQ